MKERVQIGANRTGIQMSPIDSNKMIQNAEETPATLLMGIENSEAVKVRTEYIQESGTLGSVPPPGNLHGVARTGFEKLRGVHSEALIDKLGERLAFERTGARLYEAVITKCRAAGVTEILPDLIRIHQSELEHFEIVKNAIERIGADPTAQTPCADATGVASMGLLQVATDPRTTVGQCLHTLLIAEMTDNAGWEMLLEMIRFSEMDTATMDTIVQSFKGALAAEEMHLQTIKRIFQQFNLQNVRADSDLN